MLYISCVNMYMPSTDREIVQFPLDRQAHSRSQARAEWREDSEMEK
jgi:hypothetical protein